MNSQRRAISVQMPGGVGAPTAIRQRIAWRTVLRRSAAAVAATALFGLSAVTFAAGTASAGQVGPAPGISAFLADVPPPTVEEFNAPTCFGETLDDPTDTNPDFNVIPDNTLVFGARLDAYRTGAVVPLYDTYGDSGAEAYPPLCGTRYVTDAGGPVSEWMFCTDRASLVCGEADTEGNLLDGHGHVVSPMDPLPGNPKLTAEQNRIIASLTQHGHSYAGVGNQSWNGVTTADLTTTDSRAALQTLVWCISDPAAAGDTSDFAQTCASNMDADEQARILAAAPADPTLALAATDDSQPVGETATFELSTNVFGLPIEITTSPTTDLAVCGGDAVLADGALTVSGTDGSGATTISLCATGTAEGTVTVDATVTPASTEYLQWNQSANPDGEDPCQVFSHFHELSAQALTAQAATAFVVAPTTTTDTSDTSTSDTSTSDTSTSDTSTSDTSASTGTTASSSGQTTGSTATTSTADSSTATSTTDVGSTATSTSIQIPTAINGGLTAATPPSGIKSGYSLAAAVLLLISAAGALLLARRRRS